MRRAFCRVNAVAPVGSIQCLSWLIQYGVKTRLDSNDPQGSDVWSCPICVTWLGMIQQEVLEKLGVVQQEVMSGLSSSDIGGTVRGPPSCTLGILYSEREKSSNRHSWDFRKRCRQSSRLIGRLPVLEDSPNKHFVLVV